MVEEIDGQKLLQKLYTELHKNGIQIAKGTSLKILKMDSTKRKDYFVKEAFKRKDLNLSESDYTHLINNNILYIIDEVYNLLTLTLKGTILLEYQLGLSDPKILSFLDDLNKSYFLELMVRTNEPLESQEKGVIIALLGLHAFSSSTAVRLLGQNESGSNNIPFKKCVDDALAFLKGLGDQYIDSTANKIWSLKVIGEDEVSARINRLNKISVKTKQIYKKDGGHHFLDVLKDSSLDKEKVVFLLKKVFDKGPLEYEKREELKKLLKSIQSRRYEIIDNNQDNRDSEIGYELSKIVEGFISV